MWRFPALADVQAKEGADPADVDHVRLPVVLARRPHGTDRHIHMTKSLPDLRRSRGRVTGSTGVVASAGNGG